VLKDDYPKAIADLMSIPPVQGKAGPWMSTQGTVLSDWVRAVALALGVPYTGKVPTMKAMVERVGGTWNARTMASELTPKKGGGNISTPGFIALYNGLRAKPVLRREGAARTAVARAAAISEVPRVEDDQVVQGAIKQRKGQAKFREALLIAYEGRCAISGCDAKDALEAAHLRRYGDGGSYEVSNGILLRADLHTLFDLGLLGIDPSSFKVLLHPRLLRTTYGKELGDATLKPASGRAAPDSTALQEHRSKHRL